MISYVRHPVPGGCGTTVGGPEQGSGGLCRGGAAGKELEEDDRRQDGEADEVSDRPGIEHQGSHGDEDDALGPVGLADEPALQSAHQGHLSLIHI